MTWSSNGCRRSRPRRSRGQLCGGGRRGATPAFVLPLQREATRRRCDFAPWALGTTAGKVANRALRNVTIIHVRDDSRAPTVGFVAMPSERALQVGSAWAEPSRS
jgi:hypothetical protein